RIGIYRLVESIREEGATANFENMLSNSLVESRPCIGGSGDTNEPSRFIHPVGDADHILASQKDKRSRQPISETSATEIRHPQPPSMFQRIQWHIEMRQQLRKASNDSLGLQLREFKVHFIRRAQLASAGDSSWPANRIPKRAHAGAPHLVDDGTFHA